MNKSNIQKYSLPLCMIIFSLIVYIIGILVVEDKLSWTRGILFGVLFSLLKLKLMERTFNKALQLPEAKARSYTTSQYMIRYILTGVVLIIAALEPGINLLGVFFGLLSMKVAAYMQLGFNKKEQK